MHRNCWVPLLFITFSYSKSSYVGETILELNKILAKDIQMSEMLPETKCEANSECPPGMICDRFFENFSSSEFSYKGCFCTEKPGVENHVELVEIPNGMSVRRCWDSWACGRNEQCLFSNSDQFFGGFCVTLNICSRSRPALLVHGQECTPNMCGEHLGPVAGSQWKCVEHEVSPLFRLVFSTDESGTVRSRRVRVCCSEPNEGFCRYGTLVSPGRKCSRHSDCFRSRHEPKEWCDEETRFCCEDAADDPDIQCPHSGIYPFVEDKCTGYNENFPSSGRCESSPEGGNGTCLFGHCCPTVTHILIDEKVDVSDDTDLRGGHETTSVNRLVIIHNDTFESNVPCDPGEPLQRVRSAFCDTLTRRIVILSQDLAMKTLKKQGEEHETCENNYECPLPSQVCFWSRSLEDVGDDSDDDDEETRASCIRNPMRILPFAMSRESTIAFFGVASFFTILFFFVTIFLNRKINRY